MGNRYDLVIFDVDGTLLDTSVGMRAAVKYVIETAGLEPLTDEQIAAFIGPPIQDSFARTYGFDAAGAQRMAEMFRERYKSADLLKAVKYDGIDDLFAELARRETAVAVATYKREDYALTLLRHFGFDRSARIMHGADNENRLKKRDIIEMCIRESGIADRRRIVMVGDSNNDAVGAAGAGIDFIGVTFGFGFKSEADVLRTGAVGCAARARDILDFI